MMTERWQNTRSRSTHKIVIFLCYKTSIATAILQNIVTTPNDMEDAEELGNMPC